MTSQGPLSENTSLALRVAAGDQAATEELYLRYGEAVHPFVLQKINRSDPRWRGMVEDILQDGFVEVIRNLRAGKFDPARGSFFPWVRTLVLRDIIDHARRERRSPVVTAEVPELPVRGPGPLTRLASSESERERIAMVRDKLATLHEPYLLALVARDLLKLSADAAATETEMTKRQHIDAYHRAKHALEKLLPNGIRDWAFLVDYVDHHLTLRTLSEAERRARGDSSAGA